MFDFNWEQLWEAILEILFYIPSVIWQRILDALAFLLENIPVPADLAAGIDWSALADMAYFFDVFGVETGLGLVAGAYTIRFLIRRIPVIG